MGFNAVVGTDQDTMFMKEVVSGNAAAFDHLYAKYFPLVSNYLAESEGDRAAGEDLAQEVFARLWQHRARFRGSSSFRTYFFGTVRNVLRERRRSKRRGRTALLDLEQSVQSDDRSDAEALLERRELAEGLAKTRAKLSEKQRQALDLAMRSGVSLGECARFAGCSESAFRQRLLQARKALREALRRHVAF